MSHAIFILIFAIVFNAFANILIKVGMVRIKGTSGFFEMIKEAIKQPALIGGVCCFILALAAYSVVLTRLNLSIAYPVMVSMGLVIVTLASFFILKETITPLQIAGFVFIIAGVWMVAR